MTTNDHLPPLAREILDGNHDENLQSLTEAIDRRERMLSPGDAVQMLARVYAGIDQFASAPVQQRAQVGSELHQVLKQLADDPNPHVQALIEAARIDVLVKMLGVDREAATRMSQAATAASNATPPPEEVATP